MKEAKRTAALIPDHATMVNDRAELYLRFNGSEQEYQNTGSSDSESSCSHLMNILAHMRDLSPYNRAIIGWHSANLTCVLERIERGIAATVIKADGHMESGSCEHVPQAVCFWTDDIELSQAYRFIIDRIYEQASC